MLTVWGTRKLKLNGSQLATVRRELAAGISPKEVALPEKAAA